MIFKSSWISKNIPTALLFLPVLWFALAISPNLNEWRCLWVLVIIQFMAFGSINAYANYKGCVSVMRSGFLRGASKSAKPIYVSAVFSLAAVVSAYNKISLLFAILVLIYIVMMLAYYARSNQEKQLSMVFIISFFQGIFLFVTYYVGINKLPIGHTLSAQILIPGAVASFFVASFYSLQYLGKGMNHDKKFPMLFALSTFIVASIIALWYIKVYMSSTYLKSVGMIIIVGFSFLLGNYIIHRKTSTSYGYDKLLYWSNWLAISVVNIFLFWLFTDYTQVTQLLQF